MTRGREKVQKIFQQTGLPIHVFCLPVNHIAIPRMKQLTEFDYFKAWLLFFLIATVIGGAVGMVTGSSIGAVLSARGMPIQVLALVLQGIALMIAMPISYLTFRAVVGKYLFPKIHKENTLSSSV